MKKKIGRVLSIVGGAVLGSIIGVTLVRLVLYLIPRFGDLIRWISNFSFGAITTLVLISAAALGIGRYFEK